MEIGELIYIYSPLLNLNSTTSFRWLLAANKNVFGIVCHDANRLEEKKEDSRKEEKIESSCRLSSSFSFLCYLSGIRMDRPFWIDGVAIFFFHSLTRRELWTERDDLWSIVSCVCVWFPFGRYLIFLYPPQKKFWLSFLIIRVIFF